MTALKSCTAFLSVRTDARGQRVWACCVHNQPICADTVSLRDVLARAREVLGRVTLAVWDGDKGEFDSEMTLDAGL